MQSTIQGVAVLIVAFLPGALHTWAFEREAGNWGVGFADRVLRFAGTTAVYQALFAYPAYLFWSRYIHRLEAAPGPIKARNLFLEGTVPGWIWVLPLVYVGFPLAIGTLAGLSVHRWPRVARILVGRDPAPRAWDYVFSARPRAVVRARLKDGSWLGGFYERDSYAAGYPEEPQDLFLERTYRVLEDGRFAQGDAPGAFEEIGSGALIRFDEVSVLSCSPSRGRIMAKRDRSRNGLGGKRANWPVQKRGGYRGSPGRGTPQRPSGAGATVNPRHPSQGTGGSNQGGGSPDSSPSR